METSDNKIINIIKDFKDDLGNKNTTFNLLLRLKQSLEFNATINWKDLYKELGAFYKDFRPYYASGAYTPDPIDPTTMSEIDYFVFGSNTEGAHDGGAAKAAMNNYEAVYGQPRGLQGKSYAIVTLDYTGKEPVTFDSIEQEIVNLIDFAIDNPDKRFWVTKIGCGISGYAIKEIAPLFANKIIPTNIFLPIEFVQAQSYQEYFYSPRMNKFFRIKNNNHIIVVDCGKQKGISELNMTNIVMSLPDDIVSCDAEDFVLATEEILKDLF